MRTKNVAEDEAARGPHWSRERMIAVVAAGLAVVLVASIWFVSRGGDSSPVAKQTPITSSSTPALSTPSTGVTGGPAVVVPASGAYLGAHVLPVDGSREAAITKLEQGIGRKLAIDHVYYRWNAPFPSAEDRKTIDEGRILFLSWTSRATSGPAAKWTDIAAGREDTLIDARAKAIRDLGHPVLMGFAAEPGQLIGSTSGRSGSPDELISAFRHIVERFRGAGATNVSWIWTLTAHEFRVGDAMQTYPGDAYVDWVGVDGYTNIQCPWLKVPWVPFQQLYSSAITFARDHSKPLAVAEFNLREDPADPSRKGTWLKDVSVALKANPTVKAVVSFDSSQSCAAVIDTSPQALAGYRALGESPLLKPTAASEAAR